MSERRTRRPDERDGLAARRELHRHYESNAAGDLVERILEAVAGTRGGTASQAPLAPEELQAVDQFHVGGLRSTVELARLAGLRDGMAVLDVGGGLGGPARTLAAMFGCRVTVLELMGRYCRDGERLTEMVGLGDRVRFVCADALFMPFAPGGFDAVWTQHSTMNVEDREGLYRGVARVLRPDGRLAMHEWMAGPAGDPHYPVPWSSDGSTSHLHAPDEVRGGIEAAGFLALVWEDLSDETLAWLERQRGRTCEGEPPPGIHLLLGAEWGRMARNLHRNLAENRCRVVRAVFEKKSAT